MTGERLYGLSLGTYAVSLVLPAVIGTHSDPNMWGWQAFSLSINPIAIVAWPSNFGYAAAAIFQWMEYRGAAVAASSVAVADMLFVAFVFLTESRGGPVHLPFGLLGPGYFAWLAAGVMMIMSSWKQRDR
jgi:hypothetical protein